MKKALSLLLCVLMLCGMFTTVNAAYDFANARYYTPGTYASQTFVSKYDTDIYKFFLPVSSKINISLFANMPSLYLELFDEDGDRIFNKYVYDNDTTKEIRFQEDIYLCEATYYISIQNNSYLGSYDLKVTDTAIYESFPEFQGGSNNTTKAASLITYGIDYKGVIAKNDNTDVYKFQMNQSGNMAFNLYSPMEYLYLELFDEHGERVWYDYVYDNDTLKEIKLQEDFNLVQGWYYLSFSGSSSYQGYYDFSFSFTPSNEFFEESTTVTNNQTSSANWIDINYQYKGQIALNDEIDIYKINITSSNPTLNVYSTMDSLDVELFDEYGNRVWYDYLYDNDTTKEIKYSKTMKCGTGVHYLSIHEDYNEGNYIFNVSDGGQIIEAQSPSASQPSNNGQGTVIGEVLNTDIRAYVDGYPIRSFNVNGYTAIVAEDLSMYGFNVVYNNDTRSLYIDEGNRIVTSSYQHIPNLMPVGSKAMDVYYTDIKTYSYGYEISGFNVNGYTIVFIEDLGSFGASYWDPASRTISFYRY